MFAGQSYEVKLVHLDPGDTLFLCTDGVTEARGGDEQDYGVERIAALLSEFHAYNPRDLADSCLSDLDDFLSGAPQQDDVTVMVLRRL